MPRQAGSAVVDQDADHDAIVRSVAIGMVALVATKLRVRAGTVPPERLAAREWYQDARFGMLSTGAYSLLGDGEWVMQNRKITVPEYEWLATTFNP